MLLTILLQVSAVALSKVGLSVAAVFAVFAGGFGISKIGKSAIEAIARQPESANDIRSSLLVSAAMIEGAVLFAIIVCFMALYR